MRNFFRRVPAALRVSIASLLSVAVNGGLLISFLLLYWHVGRAVTRETTASAVLVSRLDGAALVIFQLVFYAALALSVAALGLTSLVLARALRVHIWATFVLTLFLAGAAAPLFLAWVAIENDCALGHPFIFGGRPCGL